MSDNLSMEDAKILRRTGNAINRAYDDRHNWWWNIGKAILAAEEEWDGNFYGDVARQAVNASGRACFMKKEKFNRIRRTAKKVREHGFSESDIRGCPFSFTFHLMQHFEKGRLTKHEFRKMCKERREYMGGHPTVRFSDVQRIDSFFDMKEQIFNHADE